jgi:hypothetical protein
MAIGIPANGAECSRIVNYSLTLISGPWAEPGAVYYIALLCCSTMLIY